MPTLHVCVRAGQVLPGPPAMAMPAPAAAPGPMAPSVEPAAATPYLEVNGMVTPEVLMDDEEYKEVRVTVLPSDVASRTSAAARWAFIVTASLTWAGPSAALHRRLLSALDARACRRACPEMESGHPGRQGLSAGCLVLR